MIGTKKQLEEKFNSLEPDTIIELTVKSEKKIRSYSQVKYYWGVIIKLIHLHTGDTPLDINESNKILFRRDTFTDVSTKEFEVYMELMRQFYRKSLSNVDCEFIIPKPNEVKELESLYNSY